MRKGFGIIEVIVAMGIFIIVASTGVVTVLHSFSANRISEDTTEATLYSQEGLEAGRSIRNNDWNNLTPGTYGLSNTGGSWSFSGTSNTSGKFTRQIIISQVTRDANGNINPVGAPGDVDPDTFHINSKVTWTAYSGKLNTVDVQAWLTYWKKNTFAGWINPNQQTSFDLPGGQDAYAVRVQGNYAYVLTNSASENFIAVDISGLPNLFVASTFSISENPFDIAISGSYAYTSSRDNNAELQIVNISDPLSPSLAGSLNVPGIADGQGVFSVGSTVYLVRASSSNDEFIIINASNPSSPTPIGSLDLGASGNEVFVSGNYAYIASSSDSQELQVIDISNPTTPSNIGSYNLTGSADALTITGFANIVIIGRSNSPQGDMFIFDVTTATSPQLVSSFTAGGSVNDVSVESNNAYAFLATEATTKEFQVVEISSLSSPTLFGSLDESDILNGSDYDPTRNRAFAVGNYNSKEFVVYAPE